MHKILIASALVLSLAGGASAMAATKPAKDTVAASKASDCAKQWKAEKKHSQTRKAFMAACEKA